MCSNNLSSLRQLQEQKLVCSSRAVALSNATKILLTVASEKEQGMESDNTCNCPIIAVRILTLEPSNQNEAMEEH